MIDFLPPWAAAWVPFVVTLVLGLLVHPLVLRLLPHHTHKRLPRQATMVVGAVVLVLALLLTLPISLQLKQQMLSLFGLAITAVVALSSTTFAANAMAGLMLRSVKNFTIGDFIRVQEHFGRVSERGLLHTEIQTEDRDLLTLPNLYLITNPVKVIRSSGTLVSCEVGLGYDVPRDQVAEQLKTAASNAGLTDGFVQVLELQDHAVLYRVNGFLGDTGTLISVRSDLRGQVLDALHGADIEIVSPRFMNQRKVDGVRMVPKRNTATEAPTEGQPEALMFDKAEHASKTKDGDARLQALEKEVQLMAQAVHDAAPADRPARQEDLVRLRTEVAELAAALLQRDRKAEGKPPD